MLFPSCLLCSVSPVEPGAKLTRLSQAYAFTEGPATAKNGDVYFTDQPNDRIVRWNGRTFEDWMKPAGRANGLAFAPNGDLIACADGENQLWAISPDRTVRALVKQYEGESLNGPNDVWVRRDGALFLTDPLYERPYWKGGVARRRGHDVFFLSADRKTFRPVATDLKQPNGIIGTSDGRTLYVSDIDAGRTYRYRAAPDGTLRDKTLFCAQGSDGMTLDDAGNVYLTGKGVTVYDRTGAKVETIAVPEPWTANATFGGRDRRTLFVTASRGVYTLRMRTRGAGGV